MKRERERERENYQQYHAKDEEICCSVMQTNNEMTML